MIGSPDDIEARYCVKRSTEWTGYKVHYTETCDQDHPRIITHVRTTTATEHDVKATTLVQNDLKAKGRQPEIHLVDQGYLEIDLLVNSQKQGTDLVGPVPTSQQWQDRTEGAYDHTRFQIDWERRAITCPNGKTTTRCSERTTWRGTPSFVFTFPKEDCLPCPVREHCSRAKNSGRVLTLYPQEQYEAQLQARQRQETEAFRNLYGERAGIESTLSQGIRRARIRYARYIGLARTHLQEIASAAAINFLRISNWLSGERPTETRISPFQALAAQL